MWKEWFYYTKGERRVIILLLLVLVVMVVLLKIESSSHVPFKIENNTQILTDSLLAKIKEQEKKYKSNTYQIRKPYQPNGKKADDTNKASSGKALEKLVAYKPKYVKQEKFLAGTKVDVNSADTTTLKKIPGIGSVISRNIVRYRDRLGGFYNVEQLLEVKFVELPLLEWLEVKGGVYRKLRVNTDGLDVLKRHPYMGYHKAKAIVDYRNRRGKIKGLSQISLLKEFSGKDLERLKYYLDFE